MLLRNSPAVSHALLGASLFAVGCLPEGDDVVTLGGKEQAIVQDQPIVGEGLPPYTLAFTYDDGPDTHTLELATYLRDAGVRATFFVNGCRIQGANGPITASGNCMQTMQFPETHLVALRALGHRIANHTQDHADVTTLTTSTLIAQVRATQTIVDRYVQDGYYLFRPPYGAWSNVAATALRTDPLLNKVVGPVNWNILGTSSPSAVDANGNNWGGDWNCLAHFRDELGEPLDAAVSRCGQYYLDAIYQRPDRNGVILFHDRQEFAPGTNYALLLARWLVERLPASSYSFAPLDAVPGITSSQQSAPASLWLGHFSDAEGWGAERSRFGTVRFADVNGDGRADVCGRQADGVYCALALSGQFAEWTRWISTEFTDALAWRPEPYSTTLQLGDINGDHRADLCGRGANGIICALSTGAGFTTASKWSPGIQFSDVGGWASAESYYGSIRLADVTGDGRADVCGRNSQGIVCALSDGTKFVSDQQWKVDDFNDSGGWYPPQYGATLQFADVNGDGKADACGRGVHGVACALSSGSGFGGVARTPLDFSDHDRWHESSARYRSIRMADINGDGRADICGRNTTGIVCGISSGDGKFRNYAHLNNAEFRDNLGWNLERYGMTIGAADVTGDGRSDICGRGVNGIHCAVSP